MSAEEHASEARRVFADRELREEAAARVAAEGIVAFEDVESRERFAVLYGEMAEAGCHEALAGLLAGIVVGAGNKGVCEVQPGLVSIAIDGVGSLVFEGAES